MSDLKKDIEEFLKSYDIERYAEIGRKGGKKGAADGVMVVTSMPSVSIAMVEQPALGYII